MIEEHVLSDTKQFPTYKELKDLAKWKELRQLATKVLRVKKLPAAGSITKDHLISEIVKGT
jgi:hypothetical protein